MEYSKISVLLLAKVEGTNINKKFFAENSIKVQRRLFLLTKAIAFFSISCQSKCSKSYVQFFFIGSWMAGGSKCQI